MTQWRVAAQACLMFGLLLWGRSASAQEFQQWNEVDFAAAWKRVDLLVPLLGRTDSNLPNPVLVAGGAILDVQLPHGWTATGGLLAAEIPQPSLVVRLPLIALTKSFEIARITISDRNRFEKLFGYPGAPVRYRNRILLDRPIGGAERWHVFFTDEIFWNLSLGLWEQNRVQLGTGLRLSPRLALDGYFLQKNPTRGGTVRVAGSTMKVTLKR